MKQLNWTLLFIIYLTAQPLLSQNEISNEKKIVISEFYLYQKEKDCIKYKKYHKIREYIELHNASADKVSIRELYFTNDPANLLKYPVTAKKKKYGKIKKNKFLPIYLNGSGKRRYAKTNYNADSSWLYLVRFRNDTAKILDTLRWKDDISYPFARYPDKENFKKTDALSPGLKNVYFKESESWKSKGISFQWGTSTSIADELQNTSRVAPSVTIGIYSRKNISSLSIEQGLRFAIRGYAISYNETVTTSKGVRQISTKGRQRIYNVDYFYHLNHRLSNRFSFYYGGAISMRIDARLKYRQQTTFTFFNSGLQTKNDITYNFNNDNTALNLIDIYLTGGFRFHHKEHFNLSLCMIYGIVGLERHDNPQTNLGYYLSMEIPLWKSIVRIKRRFIFT